MLDAVAERKKKANDDENIKRKAELKKSKKEIKKETDENTIFPEGNAKNVTDDNDDNDSDVFSDDILNH